MKKILLFLIMVTSSSHAGIDYLYSGMFSFGGSAGSHSGIEVNSNGEMEIEFSGSTWTGTGPDNVTRTIYGMKYQFPGNISGTFPDECYKSSAGSYVMVGWGVYQPNVTSSFTQSMGALYSSIGTPVSAGSYYKIDWGSGTPVPSGYQFDFVGQYLSGFVYVTDGPSGMYTPVSGNGSTYVHNSGDVPNVRPYIQVDYSDCGTIFKLGSPIPSPPVIDPEENVVCDFFTDGDIDLGIVDSSSASGRYASTYLYTQCTDDATVTAKIQKSEGGNNELQMGGLNLQVIFDNSSDTKTYSANTSQNSQIISGQVTNVGTLIPGDYSQSMVVYLNYE